MPQTLILIERLSDIPQIEAWLDHFSGTPDSDHVRIVLMKGPLHGKYSFVTRLPWHLRGNPQRTITFLQNQFSFQVVIHVGRYMGLKSLLSEGCRYIYLSPLGHGHGLFPLLFWERDYERLSLDNKRLNPGSVPFHACMACFSEKGVADQFKPLKERRMAGLYQNFNYAVIYVGYEKRRKEVGPLVRAVLKRHDRCVLIVKNRVHKYSLMTRYAFNKDVVISDDKNAYPLLSILKKCREVFVSTDKDALIGIMLGKKVRGYGADGLHALLTSEDCYKSILPGYCVMPSFFLFEEGFLPHLIQADISQGPVIDGIWACRLNARGDKRRRRDYQRKIKKLIGDPKRFFQDSKKGWVRQWGRMVFKLLGLARQ